MDKCRAEELLDERIQENHELRMEIVELKAQLKEGEDSEWVRVRRDKFNHLLSKNFPNMNQRVIAYVYLTTTEGGGDEKR